ncbi:hypothetical protein B0T25DRAFT_282291 [Lasiosphaeria hispida]|uniref:AB hydrolase-1 domain-containing protein n=1 Tax=Lasiosphaeria hispida TaxID=260671 RepID=A0AAJ0HBN3_9PEZI|nr:hypothetical protein B0T25DRAFT_282291 [Lasiosphaeria hispida]
MIDHSLFNLVEIRACIVLFRYAPLIEALLLVGCALLLPIATALPFIHTLTALLIFEGVYAASIYLPHKARLRTLAKYPPPLTRTARAELFERCVVNVSDWERYLGLWFLCAPAVEIKRDNVRDFLLWAFFDRDAPSASTEDHDNDKTPLVQAAEDDAEASALEQEVETFLARTEALQGRKFAPGRGSAVPLRLTIDAIPTVYRSVIWYAIVALVDLITSTFLLFAGFAWHPPSPDPSTASAFPPTATLRAIPSPSPSPSIGYWFRPHRSTTHLPVLFIHGIGVGLWPYTKFLTELTSSPDGGGDIGILALEILPVSTRLTSPLLTRTEFLSHLATILDAHPDWKDGFVLVSHSYGSVLTTHVLRSAELALRVKGVVMIDPVSVLLHLPDVAYNFTRRRPRTANQWQLWYFASMDVGVAEGLGRHFFWRENIIWREELVGIEGLTAEGAVLRSGSKGEKWRKVAVCLSGRDLIVDTRTVARYLAGEGNLREQLPGEKNPFDIAVAPKGHSGVESYSSYVAPSGIEILWFPTLDHAQVFDAPRDRGRVLEAVRKCCRIDTDVVR